ncbi:MAG: ribonuclease III [Patescibacteria group bacterium]
MDIKNLEEKIGVEFKKKELLKEALTHRSYLNENPNFKTSHNERLEYLGDAVLELITTEFLYEAYPSYQEGQLTTLRAALVNYQMLGKIGKEINLDKYLLLSRGESKDTGKAREVILANTVEALIGSIYLDQGYEVAKKFIKEFVFSHLEEILSQKLYRDPKSTLQEIAQNKLKLTPTYKVLSEAGPDHNKKFVIGVYLGENISAEGKGTSKQEAEINAAESALKNFKEGEPR